VRTYVVQVEQSRFATDRDSIRLAATGVPSILAPTPPQSPQQCMKSGSWSTLGCSMIPLAGDSESCKKLQYLPNTDCVRIPTDSHTTVRPGPNNIHAILLRLGNVEVDNVSTGRVQLVAPGRHGEKEIKQGCTAGKWEYLLVIELVDCDSPAVGVVQYALLVDWATAAAGISAEPDVGCLCASARQ
jgi:hypothetical protein